MLGRNLPLVAFGSISPPVHLFGDPITVKVAVVADRKYVAPGNVRVLVHFAPYQPVAPPTVTRSSSGRFLQLTWTWTLRCLTVQCLPQSRTEPVLPRLLLPPRAHRVRVAAGHGSLRAQRALPAGRGPVPAQPERASTPSRIHTLVWGDHITPVSRPHVSRRSGSRLLARSRARDRARGGRPGARHSLGAAVPSVQVRGVDASVLLPRASAHALLLGRAHDDETLQRKALERVADELPFDVHELSETARALAWSPETPDTEDVEEISERAGISRHNGEPRPVRGTTLLRRGATRLGDLAQLSGPCAAHDRRPRRSRARAGGDPRRRGSLSRTAGSGRADVLPVGAKTGVLVLDVSASVSGPPFERAGAVVRGLVRANQAMGLVMFSDVGYELLPPNSPPSSMQQFLRFFAPKSVHNGAPLFGQSPWSQFSGGTRISTGLIAGQAALRRAHVTDGSLVLLSDLNDSEDDRDALVTEAQFAPARACPDPDPADQRLAAERADLHPPLRLGLVRRSTGLHEGVEATRSSRSSPPPRGRCSSSASFSSDCSPPTSGSIPASSRSRRHETPSPRAPPPRRSPPARAGGGLRPACLRHPGVAGHDDAERSAVPRAALAHRALALARRPCRPTPRAPCSASTTRSRTAGRCSSTGSALPARARAARPTWPRPASMPRRSCRSS